MKIFNMKSNIFSHNGSSTVKKLPKYFVWDFSCTNGEIDFYIDADVVKGINEKKNGRKKILWTLESQYFNNGVFDFIKSNLILILETFDLILTYNYELLKLNEKFKWIPAMGSWIDVPQIYKKNKLISMITSNKSITPQQKFRVNYCLENTNYLDLYGIGYNKILNKEDGLKDYMFSVCIENDSFDSYFTEKILDCFATGTIPIYKGTKKILDFFDSNGIIFLDDINLSYLSEDIYEKKLNSIINNFEIVQKFLIPEDFFYEKYITEI